MMWRMKTLGIAVAMKARPTIAFVVLDDHADQHDPGAVTVVETIEVPLEDRPQAEQLGEAAKVVRGRVQSLSPDAVVVRRADYSGRSSNQEGRSRRLLIEGAVTSAAYAVNIDTTLLTGKECGQAHGSDKATVDAQAGAWVQKKYQEAAAAALARLTEGRSGAPSA